jgi:hypothetical protein
MLKYLTQIGISLALLATISCSTHTRSEKVITNDKGVEKSVDDSEAYLKVRSRWTVRLNPVAEGSGSSGFRSGGARGNFPLIIEATMMNEQVIESALLYYRNMAEMTPQEADAFRQAYWNKNNMDRFFLIEVLLQTSWVEDYLDLKRWTIFIENDQGKKQEPLKVVAHPVSSRSMKQRVPQPDQGQPMSLDWKHHQKVVFLYFPKKDLYGNPTIPKDTKRLKIVFILEEGGTGRAEGSWVF